MHQRKMEKINELIKRQIGQILLRNCAVGNCLLTVSRVKTADNLRSSRIYLSILPEEKAEEVFTWIDKNLGNLQYTINRQLKMKPVPKLIFEHDISGIKMTQTLEAMKNTTNE